MFVRQTLCLSSALFSCFTLSVFVFLLIFDSKPVNKYQLEKVVILSRHNLRTPLSKNLEKISPFSWPQWREKPGYLTEKGFILEGYMGTFFKYWLNTQGLLLDVCPNEEDLYVYANNMQRTIQSAQAFVSSAFPNCNVTVHRSTQDYDPVFSPYIHNDTDIFRKIAVNEMSSVLHKLKLKSAYESIENILDYQASDLCKIDKKCDMSAEENILNITSGKKPSLSGPLKLCNEVIDAFFMEYYSGLSLQDVAWGKLSEMGEWQSILPLNYGYHNVTYNTKHVARDIAKPLLKYMSNLLINKQSKVSLLMGHDANINVVLNAMEFEPFILDKEFVSSPIGGKIVFQKWQDLHNKEFLLRVNYVYQSLEQIRNSTVLSKSSPPRFHLLGLKNCKLNGDGFCSWDAFVNILNNIDILLTI